jgi:ribosomal protein S14
MTKQAVLIRDRETGGIVRLRILDEPAKLRVCRICLRAHAEAGCPSAA